jgi:transposase
LWTFVVVEGVEPTNNHAERVQRLAVLYRKNCFGCHSDLGCRFVERLLTVVQTLRLQKRPVLQYLKDTLIAHRSRTTPPSLVLVG